MLKNDILNDKMSLNFSNICNSRRNHRHNSGTQTNAVTWRTAHQPMVADAFRSKNSSSAPLVQSDTFQVTIQVLVATTSEIHMRCIFL